MKIFGSIFILSLFFFGCENINSLHEEYLDRGEKIYTGVVDSLELFPGYNRILCTWQINSDPRITKTVIYWNEGTDSLIVDVTRTQQGPINMEALFDIAEGNYIFEFVTKDDLGHRSLSTERSIQIYGGKYISRLQNRFIKSFNVDEDNNLIIVWYPAETTVQYTTVSFVDYSEPDNPLQQIIQIENSETETILSGIKSGEKFSVVTSYLPVGSLDILDALPSEYEVP